MAAEVVDVELRRPKREESTAGRVESLKGMADRQVTEKASRQTDGGRLAEEQAVSRRHTTPLPSRSKAASTGRSRCLPGCCGMTCLLPSTLARRHAASSRAFPPFSRAPSSSKRAFLAQLSILKYSLWLWHAIYSRSLQLSALHITSFSRYCCSSASQVAQCASRWRS